MIGYNVHTHYPLLQLMTPPYINFATSDPLNWKTWNRHCSQRLDRYSSVVPLAHRHSSYNRNSAVKIIWCTQINRKFYYNVLTVSCHSISLSHVGESGLRLNGQNISTIHTNRRRTDLSEQSGSNQLTRFASNAGGRRFQRRPTTRVLFINQF